MMALSENEINDIYTEIQYMSSTQKILVRPALHTMLDLICPSFSVLPAETLRRYLARIKVVNGLVKVL